MRKQPNRWRVFAITLLFACLLAASRRPLYAQGPRAVMAYPRDFIGSQGQGGAVDFGYLELSLLGPLPVSVGSESISWQVDWDGRTETTQGVLVSPNPRGRAVRLRLIVAASAFTAANNYGIALRPRAILGDSNERIALDGWIVMTLANPPGRAGNVPRLLAASVFEAYGAISRSSRTGVDSTGTTALHAQKTDVTVVDVDRPPLVDATSNPSLDLARGPWA